MKITVNLLAVGERFTYNGKEFVVTSREDYPFAYARCLTEPNEYEGHEVCFDYDMVEAADNAKHYKQEFVEARKHHFVLKETLVEG